MLSYSFQSPPTEQIYDHSLALSTKYHPTNIVTPLLTPLRPLLSTKNDFLWSPERQQSFDATKNALTMSPVLSYFRCQ